MANQLLEPVAITICGLQIIFSVIFNKVSKKIQKAVNLDGYRSGKGKTLKLVSTSNTTFPCHFVYLIYITLLTTLKA